MNKCKKYPYRTRLEAAIDTLTRPVRLYTYICPNCNYWHLTKQKQIKFNDSSNHDSHNGHGGNHDINNARKNTAE